MKTIKTALSCLLLASALPSFATTVVSFDAEASANPSALVDPGALVGGSKPTFGNGLVTIADAGTVWLAASKAAFPNVGAGNFYGSVGNPTDKTSNTGALTLVTSSFTVDIAGGFNGLFSVDFAGESSAYLVALGRAGNILATTGPTEAADNGACDDEFSCNWQTLSFDLGSGVDVFAVEVVGASNLLQWFDNLSFENLNADPGNPPSNVPEPGSVALSLTALGALGWTRKRFAGSKRG